MDLRGVFVPAVTPFDSNTGDVDLAAMRLNLKEWLAFPLRGVVIGGSTGEAVLLDDAERDALIGAAREVTPADRLLIAGTGTESTRATLERCASAAAAGADAVLVQPPAFYRKAMTPRALARHYREVADGSPVPVILYQVPLGLSTLDLPTGLIAELSAHPNIVGMKDSRGSLELVGELIGACRAGFQVLAGSGSMMYASLEVGAVGGILAVANLDPERSAAVVEAFDAGRMAEAGRLQEEVAPLHKTIVAGFGVPGVKAAVDLLGFRGGDPRPPLEPLAEEGREEVRRVLDQAGLMVQRAA